MTAQAKIFCLVTVPDILHNALLFKLFHLFSLVDTEGLERESLIVNETGVDEAEEEDEEEVDTTGINNAIVITDNASASNSMPTMINNII